jgi:Protein of unknown function (DUF4231)
MVRPGETSGSPRPIEVVPTPADADPTWDRLEDQIRWYDGKSGANQRRYKLLKLLEIAVAASLPVVAAVHSPVWVTGGLAAVIVVLESVQHLYQYQQNWITYRSTAEALKHERYLYLGQAGPYTGDDRHRQLAERLEGLISQEHAQWTVTQKSPVTPPQAR